MKLEEAREIFAFCFDCDKTIAEIDLNSYDDPDKYKISRRVVYESAKRHREMTEKYGEHEVLVYDLQEFARREPN